MSSAKRILFVVVVGTIVGLSSTTCQAQSSLAQPTPAAEQPAGAPEGEGDKSVLTAEQAGEEPAEARDLCRCIGETESQTVSKIEQALRGPLRSAGLDFVDQPLEEVVNFLQDDYGIPVQLDLPALDEMGLGPAEKVTVNLHNVSLQSALRLMLKKLGLTYLIQNEVLMITSPEEAEADLVTCVYDATGLVDDASEKTFDALIDTIVSCISTETWAENGGGEAEIRMLKPGLLVVSQTQAVQAAVRGLLMEIRDMRRERPAPADATARVEPANGEPLITRSYLLQIRRTDQSDNLRSELRDLIVQSMPNERWTGRLDDGQAVVLTVLPDRIVVRHKQSVHDELQKLLRDSGVAALAAPGGKGGGGGIFQADPPIDNTLIEG